MVECCAIVPPAPSSSLVAFAGRGWAFRDNRAQSSCFIHRFMIIYPPSIAKRNRATPHPGRSSCALKYRPGSSDAEGCCDGHDERVESGTTLSLSEAENSQDIPNSHRHVLPANIPWRDPPPCKEVPEQCVCEDARPGPVEHLGREDLGLPPFLP